MSRLPIGYLFDPAKESHFNCLFLYSDLFRETGDFAVVKQMKKLYNFGTQLTKLEVTMKCCMPCSISLVSLDAQLDAKVLYKNYNKGFIIVNQT